MLHSPRRRTRSIAAATLGALALLGSLLVATPAQALNDTGTGGVFVPATSRFLDTGRNIGGYDTPMPAKGWRTVKVTGVNGVPNDGTVGAVSVVATAASITGQGILNGRPDASASSTLMGIYGGEDKQNTSFSSVLAVSADGTIQVQAETSIRLILDLQGYYTANTDGTAPGGFVPLNGTRIADTRTGLGLPQQVINSGERVDLQVTGRGGIPKGASSVIINMIAVNRTASTGYLTPYATGDARPSNSFNYAGSVATSMQAQVKLSADGKITIYNANSNTDLVIDNQGYFTAAGKGGAVFTPGAGRAYDTRTSGNTALAKNETRSIQIAGKAGVPVMGSGINAVVLSLTSLKSTAGGGNATVWADGATRPNTTSINFDETTIRTNTITVPLGANGKIAINNVADVTNYVFDVQGWYANPAAPTVTCEGPYSAGSWTKVIPQSDITCSVSMLPATASNEQVAITIDDELDSLNEVSETAATTASLVIPAQGGVHVISVELDDALGKTLATNSYSFGLGDWASKSLFPTPANGVEFDTAGSLAATPSGDNFGPDTQFRYTITSDPDGITSPIAVSDWISDSYPVPADALTAGATYYWSVSARGTSGGSSAVTTLQSPMWSFIASAAPKATVTCPEPYKDSTWQREPLSSAISCDVTVPAAYTNGAKLTLIIDGIEGDSSSLSSEKSTAANVTIPAGAAAHSIVATTTINATSASTGTTFGFGTGLWSRGNYVPSIANGADSNDIAPDLYANMDGAPFSDNVKMQYTVSTGRDGTGIVAQSNWSAQPLSIAEGTLVEGQTYYWRAEAQGPLNDGSGTANTISPTWSFIATPDPSLTSASSPQSSQGQVTTASSCPTWLFIGVRGTTAAAGSGKSPWGSGWTKGGFGANEKLSQKLKRDVSGMTVESLNYPATWSGGRFTPVYWNSVSAGQSALKSELNSVARKCPSTKVWIAGHSQGAQVVEDVLAEGNISKTAKLQFWGAALGGNPTYKPGEKVNAPGNGTGFGKLSAWHHSVDGLTAKNKKGKRVQQVRSWCYSFDLFCQPGTSLDVHNSYANETTASAMESWLRQFQ